MARVLGTIGSQGHGKTALLEALQGSSDGKGWLDLPTVGPVAVIDFQGDEEVFASSGRMGLGALLLVVAADVRFEYAPDFPLDLGQALPAKGLVLALSRSDLVDPETVESLVEAWTERLNTTRFAGASIVPTSTITGQGLDALRSALATICGSGNASDRPWTLPVERGFLLRGQGLLATGIVSGSGLAVGAVARLEPGGHGALIRSIRYRGESENQAFHGQRVTVNLEGVDERIDIGGLLLGAEGSLNETSAIDAKIRWIQAPRHGTRIRIAIGTDEVLGRLFLDRTDDSLAQIRFDRPTAATTGQAIVVSRYMPAGVIGGGEVTTVQAVVVRKSESGPTVSDEELPAALVAAIEACENGASTDFLCKSMRRSRQELGSCFEKLSETGQVLGYAGLWFTKQTFALASEKFLTTLLALHARQPHQTTLPRERVVHAAQLTWAGKPLDRILVALASEKRVIVHGVGVRHPDFTAALPARQRQLLDRVLAELNREPVNVPSAHEIARALVAPHQAILEILRLGVKAGDVVEVAEDLFYSRDQLESIKKRVVEIAQGNQVSAATIRDALGTSRRYIIPILEHLDSVRFTTRIGDLRIVNGRG